MPRWPAVLLLAVTGLAAQQPPDAARDSSHVARVLALLETSDSTVCELAGQAISNGWGFSWEPRLLPTPMPMPMPTPMPMPMAMHRGSRPHVRVHVHRGPRWLGEEADPRDLMRPFPAELMRMWPISTRVNKPENDDPSIVEPIELATAVA